MQSNQACPFWLCTLSGKSAQTSITGSLEEEEKKKKEEAEEAKSVDQRTRKHLHEQLAEQAQLEMVQITELNVKNLSVYNTV